MAVFRHCGGHGRQADISNHLDGKRGAEDGTGGLSCQLPREEAQRHRREPRADQCHNLRREQVPKGGVSSKSTACRGPSVMVAFRFQHAEAELLGLLSGFKPQGCVELVRLCRRCAAGQSVMVIRVGGEVEMFGACRAVDGNMGDQAIGVAGERQAHPFAVGGIDDLDQTGGKTGVKAEGLWCMVVVPMSATGGTMVIVAA